MNSITVAGRIGKDMELRHTSSGDAVGQFSLADDQGKDKPPIWWRCQLWGKRAESLQPYLTKGASVTVTGRLQEREWTDKQGQPQKTMELNVTDLALQGGRQDSQGGSAPAPRQQTRPDPAPSAPGGFEDMDDEIPFTDPMKRHAFVLAAY